MDFEKLRSLLENNKDDVNNAVKTIGKFQNGDLKPLKTSMEHLNNACIGGIIPGLIISIGARPSQGKTYTLHQLQNDILSQTTVDVAMLLYNWEMPWFSLILIQLKKVLKKSFKEILNKKPTKEELVHYEEVMSNMRDNRLTTVSKPLNPIEWDFVTREWIKSNLDKELLIIGTDHLGITVGDNKTQTIYQLMEYQNAIKLDYPNKVCFLNLFQLKREIEAIWRAKDTNPVGLRVTSEYLFGADSMMQTSDIVMAQVIPERANMELYASVNKEKYKHLEEHFQDDINPTSDYVRLKGNNRIYFEYIKKRLQDDDPNLYCEVLNKEKEDFINTTSEREKDYAKDEDDIEF